MREIAKPPPVAGSVLIISRPHWESPSDVPVLLQANIAQPSARDPRGRDDEEALTAAVIRLASQYGRYGYRRITALLRTEGWHVNAKRVQRIWWREGLKVPQKQPETGQAVAQRRILHPSAAVLAQSRLVL